MQRLAKKRTRFRIGMRTIKTVIAVIIAMTVVQTNISPHSNLTLAMLGAVAAVQPSFRESIDSCLAQIIGTVMGGIVGNLLLLTPLPTIVITGIAVVLVITVYNLLHINYAPSLPILVVVILCTTPDVNHVTYALGRLWDTCIGLAVGLVINTLIFPYDNSRQIRFTVESLDRHLIKFLEDMFDGDDILPNPEVLVRNVDSMERMLNIFSQQRIITNLKLQRREVAAFKVCEGKAKALVARIQLLARMGTPGHLSQETYDRLIVAGANIRDLPHTGEFTERDIVINYHIKQILTLRRELLEALGEEIKIADGE
ncbi:MAG: FUSC family protein [Oscillospiraceae bacterium]|nr:FUSC family protein [Oscillospiraceae bacterium]